MSRILSDTKNGAKLFGQYTTLDNGGDSFLVKVFVDKTNVFVKIYKALDEEYFKKEGSPKNYDQFIIQYDNIKSIFIPQHVEDNKINKKYEGNSILINLYDNRYVEVGESIYEFTAPESIKRYSSIVGLNAKAKPVAYSKNYLYFMLDPPVIYTETDSDYRGEMIKKDKFKKISYNGDHMYQIYFDTFEYGTLSQRKAQGLLPFQDMKIIHKRIL